MMPTLNFTQSGQAAAAAAAAAALFSTAAAAHLLVRPCRPPA